MDRFDNPDRFQPSKIFDVEQHVRDQRFREARGLPYKIKCRSCGVSLINPERHICNACGHDR